MTGIVSTLGIGAFTLLLADAAISDIRSRRIPDRDPILLGLLFVAVFGFTLTPQSFLLHLAAALCLFVGGAMLFASRVWGGGDVKLVAAIGLWTGFAGLPRFLLVMALTGGALALLILVLRALASLSAMPGRAWRLRLAASKDVPYGVAIVVAGLDWAAGTIMRGF